jgi:outer membrane protein assembly factor BamC
MTFKFSVGGVLVVAVLTACSSFEERQIASGSFEYLKEQPGQEILLPDDVDSPRFSDNYKLPSLGENAPRNILGDKLSVLSPALVLPLVTGSRIEDGSQEATVWFDQVDDSQALDTTIWNSLINFLDEQGIGVDTFDKEQQRLVTDWMVIEQEEDSSWYSLTKSERSIGKRFEFKLESKLHGRTAALKVKLVEYKETVNDQLITDIAQVSARRKEVEMLNKVIGHYAFEIRVANAKRIRLIREGLAMELGFDEDGEAAFVVDAEYDVAWPRLLLVLRKLGFDVKDYDKSNGLLFVKYNGTEAGWWSSLWSEDENALSLENDEYRFKIGNLGPKTSVTVLDNESKAFPVNKLSEIYPTFSRTMSADDLDI